MIVDGQGSGETTRSRVWKTCSVWVITTKMDLQGLLTLPG
jgi:hypothetical protein